MQTRFLSKSIVHQFSTRLSSRHNYRTKFPMSYAVDGACVTLWDGWMNVLSRLTCVTSSFASTRRTSWGLVSQRGSLPLSLKLCQQSDAAPPSCSFQQIDRKSFRFLDWYSRCWSHAQFTLVSTNLKSVIELNRIRVLQHGSQHLNHFWYPLAHAQSTENISHQHRSTRASHLFACTHQTRMEIELQFVQQQFKDWQDCSTITFRPNKHRKRFISVCKETKARVWKPNKEKLRWQFHDWTSLHKGPSKRCEAEQKV